MLSIFIAMMFAVSPPQVILPPVHSITPLVVPQVILPPEEEPVVVQPEPVVIYRVVQPAPVYYPPIQQQFIPIQQYCPTGVCPLPGR